MQHLKANSFADWIVSMAWLFLPLSSSAWTASWKVLLCFAGTVLRVLQQMNRHYGLSNCAARSLPFPSLTI
uniref:Putative secreted protein n=1 Tax=Anopheles darlingi TaxID=43151 RepID=A0A2M4DQ79_ANODA